MLKKLIVLLLISVFFVVNAQEAEDDAKYTVVNAQINQVVQTTEGLIVRYRVDGKSKTTYIPNKFFREKIAVRIDENNTKISPQMSVILKDTKPYRVKLYLANNQSNMTYRITDLVTDKMKESFNIEELQIELW